MKKVFLLLIVLLIVASCGSHPEAGNLKIEWQPVDHMVGGSGYFQSKLTLINNGESPLGNKNWAIYFNSLRAVMEDGTGLQRLSHQGIEISLADQAKSGDYYVMKPLKNFKSIQPGEQREFDIYLANWAILKTDAPAGFHISFNGAKPAAILSKVFLDPNNPKHTSRHAKDNLPVPTPESRYADNEELIEIKYKDRIIPRPYKLIETGEPLRIQLTDIKINYSDELNNEAKFLNQFFKTLVGKFPTEKEDRVYLKIRQNLDVDNDGKGDAESYIFTTKPDSGIVIVGSDRAGVFYGIQTLRQLVSYTHYKNAAEEKYTPSIELPQVIIYDKPRFEYRGMMLDVARHFQSKETVLKLLDLLAFFKVNKFHFHLNDDEGWRLEIPEIPELSEYGAKRGHDLKDERMLHMAYGSGNNFEAGDNIIKPANELIANFGIEPEYNGFEQSLVNFAGKGWGYYTTEDFEDIIYYAAERHIDVIPEVEMPAHARAAVQSMEYRYRKYKNSDPQKATQFRLIDPADTSQHTTVQSYTDNFVNPGLESTYNFLETVVNSIKNRYDAVPGAELTAIHGGGDELPSLKNNVWWQGSPAVKNNPETKNLSEKELVSYFSMRWQKIIKAAGADMMGWSDLFHNTDSSATLDGFIPLDWNNVWTWGNEDFGYKMANRGYNVILSHATNLYLDNAYNKDPEEPGFYWADFVDTKKTFYYRPFNVFANATMDQLGNPIDPKRWQEKERLTVTGKNNILGIQTQLWGEIQKVPEFIEYFTFPKTLGAVERAWNMNMPSENNMDKAWQVFANSLGQNILPILDFYQWIDIRNEVPNDIGVKYRVPLPGAELKGGVLKTNIRFPGLKVEYSKNDGKFWREWTKPAKLAPPVKLRTKTKGGRYSRVVEIVE